MRADVHCGTQLRNLHYTRLLLLCKSEPITLERRCEYRALKQIEVKSPPHKRRLLTSMHLPVAAAFQHRQAVAHRPSKYYSINTSLFVLLYLTCPVASVAVNRAKYTPLATFVAFQVA